MCGLCGLIGEITDWTDTMSTRLPRRQQRLRRIKVLNILLAPQRLKISDFHGTNYVLQTATGKSSIANGFTQLMQEIENLAGQKIDVLSPEVLTYLEQL